MLVVRTVFVLEDLLLFAQLPVGYPEGLSHQVPFGIILKIGLQFKRVLVRDASWDVVDPAWEIGVRGEVFYPVAVCHIRLACPR